MSSLSNGFATGPEDQIFCVVPFSSSVEEPYSFGGRAEAPDWLTSIINEDASYCYGS